MVYKDLIKFGEEHNVEKKLCSYLISNYLNLPNTEAFKNVEISKELEIKYKKAIKRLKKEPIQYIVGSVDFYGYKYIVTKDTLIPRFETEELVENAIKFIKEKFNSNVNVVDIGTGTGCIGITLKRELPLIDVTITDISKKALKIAELNSAGINIHILKGNMLKPLLKEPIKYDVIISNPPYISYNEPIDKLINKEPSMALYAKNNGLYYYEQILKNCKNILNNKYMIAFEIGCNQKEKIIELVHKYLENIEIIEKKDLQDRDRMLFIFSK